MTRMDQNIQLIHYLVMKCMPAIYRIKDNQEKKSINQEGRVPT